LSKFRIRLLHTSANTSPWVISPALNALILFLLGTPGIAFFLGQLAFPTRAFDLNDDWVGRKGTHAELSDETLPAGRLPLNDWKTIRREKTRNANLLQSVIALLWSGTGQAWPK
jgi:hypothetical protein